MGRWRESRERRGFHFQVRWQLIPPLAEGGLLLGQALLHLGLAVGTNRVIHMHEDLVEDDRETAHLRKARGGVGSRGRVLPAAFRDDAKGGPGLILGGIIN